MKDSEKTFLGIIAVLMIFVCAVVAARMFGEGPRQVNIKPPDPAQEEIQTDPTQDISMKVYANIFFIGQNESREEVYRAVKREYNEATDGPKIKFAILSLVAGPKSNEKSRGVYSEIPSSTRVIAVTEQDDRVIIDLSQSFEAGGGTDSLYKRLYQVIKTATNNTDLPVYLYINGKKADVIGGEGIMLTQPLGDNSLGN